MGTIGCQYNILYLMWKSRQLQARTDCLCVLGPVLVKYMRSIKSRTEADKASAYQTVLHMMSVLLIAGSPRRAVQPK